MNLYERDYLTGLTPQEKIEFQEINKRNSELEDWS